MRALERVCERFNLNQGQRLAFRALALRSYIESGRDENQLRLAILGEGGTGKSRIIEAWRFWYDMIGKSEEFVVTATTGAAASNIGGVTVHSAVGLPVKGPKFKKPSSKAIGQWTKRR
jgi:hypothetical protein